MIAASEARAILARQFEALFGSAPPWPALRLLLAQSRGEGQWGELGGFDAEGTRWGNNWGAVQSKHGPPCPYGTFEHGDSRPTATGQVPFRWCFQGYLTNDDGARDFLKHALVYRPAAKVAVLTGDSRTYAKALYGNGSAPYYGGFGATVPKRIQSYVDFLDRNAALVDQELGTQAPDLPASIDYRPPFVPPVTSKKQRGPGVVVFALIAAMAAAVIRRE